MEEETKTEAPVETTKVCENCNNSGKACVSCGAGSEVV